MGTLSLADIAAKADDFADHLSSVEGLKTGLRIIAQNVRDAADRQSKTLDRIEAKLDELERRSK